MATSIDELRWIRSLQAGDQDSFDALVRQYRPGLLSYARRRTVSNAAAEDAVQECFLRAFRSASRLNDDSRLGPWLYKILHNVCIDEANRRSREAAKTDRAGSEAAVHSAPSIEQQLGLNDDTTQIRLAFENLPDDYQDVLRMRFVDEMSYPEVAKVSGLTEVNARARVSRARSMMRALLTGAAAVPMFLLALFRRSDRTQRALLRIKNQGNSPAAQAAANGATQANRIATMVSPTVETATNLVSSSPMAAPIVGRVAAGIVTVAAVGFTAAEAHDPTPVRPAAVVTAVTLAPTSSVVVVQSAAPVTVATTPASTDAPTTEAPTTVAATEPPVTPAPTAPPTTLDLAPYVAPTTAPPTTVVAPAPASHGGDLAANSITLVADGPRYDVSGPVQLSVGGQVVTGVLQGRLGVDDAIDGQTDSPFTGDLTIVTDSGETIDVRLSGIADGRREGPSYVITGSFSVSTNSLGLVPSGSFAGSFESGFISLTLAA